MQEWGNLLGSFEGKSINVLTGQYFFVVPYFKQLTKGSVNV